MFMDEEKNGKKLEDWEAEQEKITRIVFCLVFCQINKLWNVAEINLISSCCSFVRGCFIVDCRDRWRLTIQIVLKGEFNLSKLSEISRMKNFNSFPNPAQLRLRINKFQFEILLKFKIIRIMTSNSEAKFVIPSLEELIPWFIDNVLTIYDARSCIQFIAFFSLIYFIGERIIGITKHLWTASMLCIVVFLYLVPARNVQMIENFFESVKHFLKIMHESRKLK